VTLHGEPSLLWRTVDEHSSELDILLQKRRDKAAGKRGFQRALRSCTAPRRSVTGRLRGHAASKPEAPELADTKHAFVKASARSTTAPRTAVSPLENANGTYAASATKNARRRSSRASARPATTLPSSGICCALRSTANTSPPASRPGVYSPKPTKNRLPLSEQSVHQASVRADFTNMTLPK